uniref:Uncharacterized protein n=1 Tax=Pasiphaea japonica whispovirus TaxID=2984286 RepID=A0A9C7EZD2_9VIRU|nr:MAG: hypothetical protein [Pasiphaea japonica whispovirus]
MSEDESLDDTTLANFTFEDNIEFMKLLPRSTNLPHHFPNSGANISPQHIDEDSLDNTVNIALTGYRHPKRPNSTASSTELPHPYLHDSDSDDNVIASTGVQRPRRHNSKRIKRSSYPLRKFIRRLNLDIVIYNANVQRYKEMGEMIQREFVFIGNSLLQTYVALTKVFINHIKGNLRNFSSVPYNDLLDLIRRTLDMYMTEVWVTFEPIKRYLNLVEDTLVAHARCLMRILWHWHYPYSGPIVFKLKPNIFLKSIEANQTELHREIYAKIRRQFNDVWWIYNYLIESN